jgi:hypothetical protein
MKIEIVPRLGFLEALPSGTFDADEAVQHFDLLMEAAKTASEYRVLLDLRTVRGIPMSTELILNTLHVDALHSEHVGAGGKPLRVALLLPEEVVHVYTFAEAPGKRVFSLFTERHAAVSWLLDENLLESK